ncbi:MAG: FAD-dependent oxidoreductase [Sandaracinaceae bacterium]
MSDLASALGALPSHLGERTRAAGAEATPRFVLYWMRTALRAHENPALDVAEALARHARVPVFVYHALDERYRYASDRHHRFILEGARDASAALRARGLGTAFHLSREGHRGPHLLTLAADAGWVVTEDLPVPLLAEWNTRVERDASLVRVDTACLVPMATAPRPDRAFRWREQTEVRRRARLATPWPEPAGPASTFVPELPFEPFDLESDLAAAIAECRIDHGVGPVWDTPGGTRAGRARWARFLESGIERYARERNDPTRPSVSRMSAYLHYGMVSPMRLAREAHARGADKFVDELLVWRELAYAFCFHEPNPAALTALPKWACETLVAHADDPRPAQYSWETLARGRTGEPLWDLAARSLLRHGELHNNLRMTWGKAILKWTRSPAEALTRLVDLNHRYALDGRDPGSYGGILWCLGALDRPFPEGPIRGTVRDRSVRAHEKRVDMLGYRAHVERRTRHLNVAVIGAGVAGLSCARTLSDHGVHVTVFDKGRRVGGRLNVRRSGATQFDHGAQYLTVKAPSFARFARAWREDDVLGTWAFTLRDTRGPTPKTTAQRRPVGAGSNRRLPEHLAADLDVRLETRVAPLSAGAGAHTLHDVDGQPLGSFDHVVVTAPLEQARTLLAAHPSLVEALGDAGHAPCWALMLAFDAPLDAPDALQTSGPIAWAARDNGKPGRPEGERWVVHASPEWSAVHLERDKDDIADRLTRALEEELGALPTPTYCAAHRWRFARVSKAVGKTCVHDPERGLTVAGDGLLGPRVEAAWHSGVAAAGRILGAPV